MNDIRTILLIGKTGNGKSTLANILTGTNKFTENSQVNSGKNIQIEEIDINGIRYQIVEAMGIGDPQASSQKTLYKLAELSFSIENGINQIFFVTDGNFTKEELETYNLLRTVVFEESIDNYLTIIRTKFPEFRDENSCEKNRQKLKIDNHKNGNSVDTTISVGGDD
jgi:ABC-type glutathione transport system ATPase component